LSKLSELLFWDVLEVYETTKEQQENKSEECQEPRLSYRRIFGDKKCCNTNCGTGFPMSPGKYQTVSRSMHSADPHLLSVYHPAFGTVPRGLSSMSRHMGGIRPVVRLGQAESESNLPFKPSLDKLHFLFYRR
jgi:hypothetical protein